MKGSCLCGRVRYEVVGKPAGTNYCHCKQCRKASGTAFATNAAFDSARFRLLAGEVDLRSYESSPGKRRHFCGHCGSPIYSRSTASENTIYLRVGSLEDDSGIEPDIHIHVASKAQWFEIRDELPQRQEQEDLWF